jgi:ribose transport system substrate-binding protein
LHRPRRKVGFVVDTAGKPFRKEVAQGIEQAAAENDVDLIAIDAEGTLRNARRAAQQLIRSEIDLAIDFQTGQELGESVASQYLEQGIPLIAIDVPHPGATFFGVNNYIAGKAGGHWLAGWVRRQWHAKIDSVVLVCPPQVNVVTARARGAYAGLQERLGRRAKTPAAIELKSPGTIEASFRALQKFLRRGRRGNVLVVAPSDTCVTGVMMALEEAGSAVQAAVFGFGGARETRALLRDPRGRFIGCVAFAPEQYGRKLIPTALRLIEGRTVPPAVFIDHDIIHCENVDLLYPNDVL